MGFVVEDLSGWAAVAYRAMREREARLVAPAPRSWWQRLRKAG